MNNPQQCAAAIMVHVFQARCHITLLSAILLPHTLTHSVGQLVSPKVESLIVTEWDYLKPACGRKNTQTVTGWAAACSLLRKAQYEMTLQTKCSFNLSTA